MDKMIDGSSKNIIKENVKNLGRLFPECLIEGQIDLDVLSQLLGNNLIEGEERFGLHWFGKRKSRR